jgi:hypothetical protein
LRHLSLRDDLSLRDEVKQPIVNAGALGPLLRHSNSKNEDLLMQCASTLANLTENMEKQVSLLEAGANGICNDILNLLG